MQIQKGSPLTAFLVQKRSLRDHERSRSAMKVEEAACVWIVIEDIDHQDEGK